MTKLWGIYATLAHARTFSLQVQPETTSPVELSLQVQESNSML